MPGHAVQLGGLRARISWPLRGAAVAACEVFYPSHSSVRHSFLIDFCLFGLCPFHSLSPLCLLWSMRKMVRKKVAIQVPLECGSAAVINLQESWAVAVTSGAYRGEPVDCYKSLTEEGLRKDPGEESVCEHTCCNIYVKRLGSFKNKQTKKSLFILWQSHTTHFDNICSQLSFPSPLGPQHMPPLHDFIFFLLNNFICAVYTCMFNLYQWPNPEGKWLPFSWHHAHLCGAGMEGRPEH